MRRRCKPSTARRAGGPDRTSLNCSALPRLNFPIRVDQSILSLDSAGGVCLYANPAMAILQADDA